MSYLDVLNNPSSLALDILLTLQIVMAGNGMFFRA